MYFTLLYVNNVSQYTLLQPSVTRYTKVQCLPPYTLPLFKQSSPMLPVHDHLTNNYYTLHSRHSRERQWTKMSRHEPRNTRYVTTRTRWNETLRGTRRTAMYYTHCNQGEQATFGFYPSHTSICQLKSFATENE